MSSQQFNRELEQLWESGRSQLIVGYCEYGNQFVLENGRGVTGICNKRGAFQYL